MCPTDGLRPRRQTLPDRGIDTQAYRQFGNAVVVPVVEFVAEAMKMHIETALTASRECPCAFRGGSCGDTPWLIGGSCSCLISLPRRSAAG
ncbi:MAG: DNA cytosine methyltransferase [Methylovirgula sp.]